MTHHLAKNISCFAFNKDGTKLALSPGDHTVLLFNYAGGKFTKQPQVLSEHDQLVTGIDWAPNSNRIVTCSEDRNAYVWELANGKWMPTLVILRINRAGYSVKWSPKEDKFAVASGSKVVSVCYFENDHDWWVSKHIKKHKSSVLDVDFHPSNLLVVTACSDYKARIFSAFVKGVDKKPGQPIIGYERLPFGEELAVLSCSEGWVKSAMWSPSGNQLAWVSHDSSICFADCTQTPPVEKRFRQKSLPYQCLTWCAEDAVIAAGHECKPVRISTSGAVTELDTGGGNKPAAGGARAGGFGGNAAAARNMFQSKVDRGQGAGAASATLKTRHQNVITHIANTPLGIVTTGVDGRLCVWKK